MSREGPGTSSDADGASQGSPRVFWVGTILGGIVLAWGVYGLLADQGSGVVDVKLRPWLLWFVGGLVVHDAVIAPLTHLVGSGVRRVRPALLRTPVQIGLALTAVLTLFAFPLLRGYGLDAQPGNTSVQPVDYTVSWLVLLAAVWAFIVALALWRVVKSRPSANRPSTRSGTC